MSLSLTARRTSALAALLLGTGALGVATASTASAAPSNDDIANAAAVSTVPSVVQVDNTTAGVQTGQPSQASCPSLTNDVWYSYTAPATGTLAVTTRASGPTRDTEIAVWSGPASGATVAGLTAVTCNDDTIGTFSHVDAAVTAGTTYYIEVGSYGGDVGAFEVQFGAGPTSTTLAATQSNRAVTLRAAVAPTTGLGTTSGTVQFFEGTTALTPVRTLSRAGTAELTLTNTALGAHTYRAVYTPRTGSGYAASTSADQSVTVTAAPTTSLAVTLTGRQVALQANVAATGSDPTPTGTVEFRDGSTTIATAPLDGSGAASATVNALTVGNHTLRAVYVPATGSSYVSSTSSDRTVTVQAAPTSTLTATAAGRSVTLAVAVAGISGDPVPTGSVTFLEGTTSVGTATLDGTGRASLVLPAAALGQHTYHVTYTPGSASPNFLPTDSTFQSVTVTAAPVTALTATATGQSVVLKATLTGGTGEALPTGTVQFLDGTVQVGSVPVSNGGATTTLTGVAPGAHTYTAVYVPSAGSSYTTSRSAGQSVTVAKKTSATTLKAPSKAKAGSRPKVRVSVTTEDGTAATGTVTIAVNGKKVGTLTLANGTGTLKLPKLKPGKAKLTATYDGTTAVGSSSAASTIKVAKKRR